MNHNDTYAVNFLDRIRRTRGSNLCKSSFDQSEKRSRQNALRLINDDRLQFATLFILQEEIGKLDLKQDLSERNQIALDICEKTTDKKDALSASVHPLQLKSDKVRSVLRWIFLSGAADDGLSDEFDQILDAAAAVLIKTHQEKSVLPVVVDLIFRRNRKGKYHHDLIWAFFQTKDASALRFIAGYLRSPNKKDVDLAHTLLHLQQDTPMSTNTLRQKEYVEYLAWLKENAPYLCFTGKNFQFSNSPVPCELDVDAKYLCKGISNPHKKTAHPFTEEESIRLNNLHDAQPEERTALANYSSTLYGKDKQRWSEWMQYPVEKQMQTAQYGRRKLV